MAKPAGRFESCCGGLCGAEAFESCCEGFGGFKACPKRATRQFRSPIETAFGANREAPWQSQQDASRAPAGFAMVPPYWPQKLFLLGFETAAWHVLGTP